MLGDDCNLQCKYCLQHNIKNDVTPNKINPKLIDWFKKLYKENDNQQIGITFYGGEPTLYWENIKELVDSLNFANYDFGMITNGKLLDSDKVKFINDNNLGTSISWDGRVSKDTRHYNVMEDNIDNILNIDRLCITSVLSSKQSIGNICEDFDKINTCYFDLHGYNASFNIDLINNFCHNEYDLTNIDFDKNADDMKKLIKQYDKEKRAVKHARFEIQMSGALMIIKKQLEAFVDKYGMDLSSSFCGNGYLIQNVDLDGNIYLCHNTHKKLGTIDNSYSKIIRNGLAFNPVNSNYEHRCKDCDVNPICNNGCFLLDWNERNKYYCKAQKALLTPIVEYAKDHIDEYRK